MAIFRRALLFVAVTSSAVAALPEAIRDERSLGSAQARQVVSEYFSLSCSHCAAFARETLPELKSRWIKPGRLRWVFRDLPTDRAALSAAMVARHLPVEHYEPFINALFAAQDRWVFNDGSVPDALWPFASAAGMDRTAFERALSDSALRDWIIGQALEAQARWNIEVTPSFVIKDKAYGGAMSVGQFSRLLGN